MYICIVAGNDLGLCSAIDIAPVLPETPPLREDDGGNSTLARCRLNPLDGAAPPPAPIRSVDLALKRESQLQLSHSWGRAYPWGIRSLVFKDFVPSRERDFPSHSPAVLDSLTSQPRSPVGMVIQPPLLPDLTYGLDFFEICGFFFINAKLLHQLASLAGSLGLSRPGGP